MKALYTALLLGASMVALAGPVHAGGLEGTWLRPKTGKLVQSYACGGGLGLKVIETGKVIMCGAKHKGGGTYEGTLTSTEDGNQYAGTVTMGGSKLNLAGCVLGGLICKNETWSRQ